MEGGDGVSAKGGVKAKEVEVLPLLLSIVGKAHGGRAVWPTFNYNPSPTGEGRGGKGRSSSGP